MVFITQLWLPILLAAVFVFVASSVLHAALPWHRSDYGKLENEADVLAAMGKAGVEPGFYAFPHVTGPGDLKEPGVAQKFERGPVGFATVIPNGVPAMGGQLATWFAYCVVVSVVAAYVGGRTLAAGADYMEVFRITGTVSFVAYAGAEPTQSIWFNRSWTMTGKYIVDGLIYGLLTAGTFGWLWP